MTVRSICIVSCTARKRDAAMPAELIYSSELFFRSRRYAHANFDRWLILSAKYGLVTPQQILEPYDVALPVLSARERLALSTKVAEQAASLNLSGAEVVSICGSEYDRLLSQSGISFTRDEKFFLPIGKKLKALGEATDARQSEGLLDSTYKSIARLTKRTGLLRLKDAVRQPMPQAGVYLFFDEQERRLKDHKLMRVVRVGTHGVASGSKATLRNRIRTHFGTDAGDGNHRSSIFRLHAGRSMLNAGQVSSIDTWGSALPDKNALLDERNLEKAVSNYLSRLYVALIDVPGLSDKANDRSYIEQNLIALFSNGCCPLDPPTSGWLGNYSAKREIRKSGLWNVNHVDQSYDPNFLDVLNYYVAVSVGGKDPPSQSLAPDDWQVRARASERQLKLI